MVFVDASVMIALISGEDDADALADVLELDAHRLCSAVSVWETVAGLSRSYGISPEEARSRVQAFLDAADFSFVQIGEAESRSAADAYAKFGKGRHRAGLNMGDCFAYACAKASQAKLLYKGQDFVHTDLA